MIHRVTEGQILHFGLNIYPRNFSGSWWSFILPLPIGRFDRYYDIDLDEFVKGFRLLCLRIRWKDKELAFRMGWRPAPKNIKKAPENQK